jgi:hypothetical protein
VEYKSTIYGFSDGGLKILVSAVQVRLLASFQKLPLQQRKKNSPIWDGKKVEQKRKPWYKSKTVWGIVAVLWFALEPQLKTFFEEQRFPSTGEWFNLVSLAVATGWTIYGRIDAKEPLSFPGSEH